MILYPTETIYALGVNALSEAEMATLFQLKGREEGKVVSWLVRDVADIEQWGMLSDTARRIAARWLPGPLTLVVPARDNVPRRLTAADGTISFRISPDPVAQQVISDFMSMHNAPLTCTSANVSGMLTCGTPALILEQFRNFHRNHLPADIAVVDDGVRTGISSTVIRVIDDEVTILRVGPITEQEILSLF